MKDGRNFCFSAEQQQELMEVQIIPIQSLKDQPKFCSSTNSNILVVEDDKINQQICTAILNSIGCQADVANNDKEAIELWENKYPLILMDCHMPEMDGFKAITIIRQLEKDAMKSPVIIALTADILKQTRERCLEVGMNVFYLNHSFLRN